MYTKGKTHQNGHSLKNSVSFSLLNVVNGHVNLLSRQDGCREEQTLRENILQLLHFSEKTFVAELLHVISVNYVRE